jgi:hypothetical protein
VRSEGDGDTRRGTRFGEESDGGGDGGGGEGEEKHGGTQPKGDTAEKAREKEGKAGVAGGRSKPEGRKEEGEYEGGSGGEVETVVVGAEGMKVPEEREGNGEDDEGGDEGRNATAEKQPQSGERKESQKRKKNASSQFEGIGRGNAEGFKSGGDGAERPNGQLGPVNGAAERSVVHVGETDPEMRGFAEVSGVGEPNIGIGVGEETGISPWSGGIKAGGVKGRAFDEEGGGAVEKHGHAAEPKGEKQDGPMAEKGFHRRVNITGEDKARGESPMGQGVPGRQTKEESTDRRCRR